MGKKTNIIITEEQLNYIINGVITEQAPPVEPASPPHIKTMVKYKCMPFGHAMAVETAIGLGLSPEMVKYSLGILGRESSFGEMKGSYGVQAPIEYLISAMMEKSSAFGDIVRYVSGKGDNWYPSMGVAQMRAPVAKEYGIDIDELMSFTGSLIATTKHLIKLYSSMQKYYDTSTPSIIIHQGKLIQNPSSSGNAALDASIIAYNLGGGRMTRSYCQTNDPNYLAPCAKGDVYFPYPKDRPDLKLTVYKNRVVKNYLPNFKTKAGNQIVKTLDAVGVRENTSYISTLGYLKEVVRYAKGFGCIT